LKAKEDYSQYGNVHSKYSKNGEGRQNQITKKKLKKADQKESQKVIAKGWWGEREKKNTLWEKGHLFNKWNERK